MRVAWLEAMRAVICLLLVACTTRDYLPEVESPQASSQNGRRELVAVIVAITGVVVLAATQDIDWADVLPGCIKECESGR